MAGLNLPIPGGAGSPLSALDGSGSPISTLTGLLSGIDPTQLISLASSLVGVLGSLAGGNPLAVIILVTILALTPTLLALITSITTIVLGLFNLLSSILAPGCGGLSAAQITALLNSVLPALTGILNGIGGLTSLLSGGGLGKLMELLSGAGLGNLTDILGGLAGAAGKAPIP